MKWIGQHIWDFISRFRNDVYLESVGTSSETNVLVVDSDGKITKNTAMAGDITGVTAGDGLTDGGTSGTVTLNVGAGTGIDVAADAISVDVSDFMANGVDNRVVTATGADAMNAESMLKFSGTTLDIGSSADHIASIQFTNDENSSVIGISNATNGGMIGTADGDVFINSSGDHNVCIGQNNTTNLKIDTDGDVVISNNLDVTGAITGDVTGNASGSSGSCTGNAATATALATARAINGVDFDGTAPITITAAGSTLSDTVTVAKGGTGATTLAADSILTGNDGNPIVAEAYLTYSTSDEELIIGNPDNGDATISRRDSSGTNTAGGNLIIQAGPATGNAAGGSVKFHSSTAGGSGSAVQSSNEVASIDKDGNLQIDGGITTGSTSFVNSSGVVQVATQGTIDHDSLANFVANEHIDWTGASAGTIHSTNIPTLNQDTTGNAATATLSTNAQGVAGATDGDVTITSDGHVVVKLDADNGESNQRFKITDNTDAVVFHVQEDGNVLLAGSTITNSGSDNDLTIESDGSMGFTIDRDNDETSQKFSFVNYNTEIASITEDGSLILGDTDGTSVSITTPAHDNGSGSNLNLAAGFATAGQTDKSGGTLALYAGQSTGTGGNEIRFYTYPAAGSTGTSLNSAVKAVTITNDGNLRVDGNVISNNATAANFNIASSRILELQHAGSYDIQLGNSTNPDVLKVEGDAQEVTINGTLELGHATDTTIARSAAGKVSIEGDDIQTQGEKIGQYFQIKIKDLNSYMFYMYNDDYWYSAGSGTLAILGLNTTPESISSANSEYQSRTACYTAIADCTVKKLQLTFYWSSSAVNAADIDFAFSKFTPITDGTAASITMNAITATDHNGSYTENKPYQKTFTFSGGNASLSAGDALGFHMRTTGGSSAQRVFVYGTAILSVELD